MRQIHAIRSHIEAGKIVRRLEGFALGAWELARIRDDDGVETHLERPIEMTANQVRAAIAVLDRVMPVLQSVQMELKLDPTEELSTDQLRQRMRSILADATAVDVQAVDVQDDLLKLDDDLLAL